ncbi:hypothetical protein N579_01260 [Corynebacterium pseudodiphtheriticum 090104]|nr:hypothetical protein N579_01260 [Corynebacterium pseudodiphtheriticum 090104]
MDNFVTTSTNLVETSSNFGEIITAFKNIFEGLQGFLKLAK